jgi:Sulfotransferase domain
MGIRMSQYLMAGIRHAFGLHRPGKRVRVFPDDILIASYPKSGNTWTRFLVANLVFPDREVGFDNLHRLILDPNVSTQREFVRAARPRIVKTHESFDPRYRRVICIVRDPRDVAVSQYHYLRKLRRIDDEYPVDQFIGQFLAGDLKRNPGSWGENVGSWLAARWRQPGFLLLRYEDLLADTARGLARIAAFGGFPADPERIAQAVERSSADKMRESEKKQGQRSMLIKGSRSDIPFVRAAKSGGWRTGLPEAQVARIEATWGDIMACLGYELVTRSPQSAFDSSLIALLTAGAAARAGEDTPVPAASACTTHCLSERTTTP